MSKANNATAIAAARKSEIGAILSRFAALSADQFNSTPAEIF